MRSSEQEKRDPQGLGELLDSIPRYPRRGTHPPDVSALPAGRPLKVAVIYEVCYRFRMPIFRRLSAEPGLRVRFFVGTGTPGTKVSNAPDLDGIDVNVLWTAKRNVASTGRNVTASVNPTLPYHLIRFRPDVLLIQGGMLGNNLIAWVYASVTRTPIVWWSLGQVAGRRFRGLSALYRNMVKWLEGRSTAFAGYSSMSIDYFVKQGYPPASCFNLVNVVDTELVERQIAQYRERRAELCRQLGLEGKHVVLFVGSLTETKGIDFLIKAYARLESLRPRLRLLIVGDGPQRNAAQQLTRQLGLEKEVIFTGAIYEDIAAYFQLGDLLVLPGTGGLAISEGMTHGLPVICSVGDGVELDLIDTGRNGYRVPPGDVDELAEKMAFALQSAERLQEMGRHSRNIITQFANINRYMSELLSAIYFAHSHRRGGRRS